MFSKRPSTYSLGMFLLGFLMICSVRAGFGQGPTPDNNNPNPTTASIANGEKTKIRGTVVSVASCQLIMRDQCGVETVVLVGSDTSIKANGHKHADLGQICPGSCVKVEGRGNCSGQLVAEEVKSKGTGCEACQPACPAPACEAPACPAPSCCSH